MVEADKSKERVFGQIMTIIEDILEDKNSEKNQLREVIGFKIQSVID